MNKVKIEKKELLKLLNWNENWKRNWNMNKVKGVNKMRKKEILLVERLIGTEKRKQKYI